LDFKGRPEEPVGFAVDAKAHQFRRRDTDIELPEPPRRDVEQKKQWQIEELKQQMQSLVLSFTKIYYR
jgi:hypothetical protein